VAEKEVKRRRRRRGSGEGGVNRCWPTRAGHI